MEDREVGEIWKRNQVWGGLSPAITRLILKLIKDEYMRQLSLYSAYKQKKWSVQDGSLRRALERFGIDRAEYLKAKEQSRARGTEEK